MKEVAAGRHPQTVWKTSARLACACYWNGKRCPFWPVASKRITGKKNFNITTDSKHFYYTSPDQIEESEINHSEQVFVNDITYIKTDEGHACLALFTDAYSKKIMGWSFDDNIRVSLVNEELTMVHNNCRYDHPGIINHNDRGVQYCCPSYTGFAKKKGFLMSTNQQSDPYENAIAERINGILKHEFGLRKTVASIAIARAKIK